jgi:hypothetical protein
MPYSMKSRFLNRNWSRRDKIDIAAKRRKIRKNNKQLSVVSDGYKNQKFDILTFWEVVKIHAR